ncbi:hypothetical protein CSA08_03215 [Candidatus Gracilibacteria bacterium]|nr:MAG: hypothetical protein CSA08_03215 [Candidatus Gracilibacteria bacterium]
MLELAFFIIFIIGVFSFFSLAPRVPTKNKDLKIISETINLKAGDKFLEIGCGTAKVSLFLSNKYPESRIIGIELSPFLYIISKIKAYLKGNKNLKILYGNALKLNFSDYDKIYMFGIEKSLENIIKPKLELELKKGAFFYSYCFKMKGWKGKEEQIKKSKGNISIYKYSL